MRKYLIIGNGRVATHFSHYLNLLGVEPLRWFRKSTLHLEILSSQAETVFLLISDAEIPGFIKSHAFLREKNLIHFSGALSLPYIESAHPLMTFGTELYDLEIYKKIVFITEKGRANFKDLIPELPNRSFNLAREKKALYHSLCVMSGNFTSLLWENTFARFEEDLKLPKEALLPYLEQTLNNLKNSKRSQLTGPIARGDVPTIVKNLDALSGDPEQTLYYAFLNFVLEKKKTLGDLRYEHLGI